MANPSIARFAVLALNNVAGVAKKQGSSKIRPLLTHSLTHYLSTWFTHLIAVFARMRIDGPTTQFCLSHIRLLAHTSASPPRNPQQQLAPSLTPSVADKQTSHSTHTLHTLRTHTHSRTAKGSRETCRLRTTKVSLRRGSGLLTC